MCVRICQGGGVLAHTHSSQRVGKQSGAMDGVHHYKDGSEKLLVVPRKSCASSGELFEISLMMLARCCCGETASILGDIDHEV